MNKIDEYADSVSRWCLWYDELHDRGYEVALELEDSRVAIYEGRRLVRLDRIDRYTFNHWNFEPALVISVLPGNAEEVYAMFSESLSPTLVDVMRAL